MIDNTGKVLVAQRTQLFWL